MSNKENKVVAVLYRALTTRIAPMVYIMMGVSAFIGFCFMMEVWVGGAESILYDSGVLIHKRVWGLVLFLSSLVSLTGFAIKQRPVVIVSSMIGFMAWLFASFAVAQDNHWYILITVTGLHLTFHAYVYLAASLGVLERASVHDHRR